MSQTILCRECINKQLEIDQLKGKIQELNGVIYRMKKKQEVGYFGSSTPSSKKPVKKNSSEDKIKMRGGAKKGHKGHGRTVFDIKEADEVINVEAPSNCPKCGRHLKNISTKIRRVIEIEPVKVKRVAYRLFKKRCHHCKKTIISKAPGVLPRGLYSNRLLSLVAEDYYIYGIPINRIADRYGFNVGSLLKAMHHIAGIVKGVTENLVKQYRNAPVKHADETTWRIDGENGYAWLFATQDTTIMTLRNTRSGKVAQEILGTSPLPGVLNVDRYAGYNKSPCRIQNCYSHLHRELSDINAQFPDKPEVASFHNKVAPLLKEAMGLRSLPISDKEFYRRAKKCKLAIISAMSQPANHLAIRSFQQIFIDNSHRLYHWVDDRAVPADNNFAERGLRPLVIARKISFGSQSDKGALTRSSLMSILLTIDKRFPNQSFHRFCAFLDNYALNPSIDPFKVLFQDSS